LCGGGARDVRAEWDLNFDPDLMERKNIFIFLEVKAGRRSPTV
jgi:hypothetical protein